MFFHKDEYITGDTKKKRSSGRPKSAVGGFALFTGIIALVVFLCLIIMSMSEQQEVVNSVSSLAVLDFIIVVCGMYLSLVGCKDNVGNYKESIIALVINSLLFIMILVMFLIGIA